MVFWLSHGDRPFLKMPITTYSNPVSKLFKLRQQENDQPKILGSFCGRSGEQISLAWHGNFANQFSSVLEVANVKNAEVCPARWTRRLSTHPPFRSRLVLFGSENTPHARHTPAKNCILTHCTRKIKIQDFFKINMKRFKSWP